jgi:hypothetical protein
MIPIPARIPPPTPIATSLDSVNAPAAVPTDAAVIKREGDRNIILIVLSNIATIPKVSPLPPAKAAKRAHSSVKYGPTTGTKIATIAIIIAVIPSAAIVYSLIFIPFLNHHSIMNRLLGKSTCLGGGGEISTIVLSVQRAARLIFTSPVQPF